MIGAALLLVQPAKEEPVAALRQHDRAPFYACWNGGTTVPGARASFALSSQTAAAPRNSLGHHTDMCG